MSYNWSKMSERPKPKKGTIEDYLRNASVRQIKNELYFARTLQGAALEFQVAAYMIAVSEHVKLGALVMSLESLLQEVDGGEVMRLQVELTPALEDRV